MGITPWEALHKYSYANITLFAASLPVYIPKDKRGKAPDKHTGTIYSHESIRADDPGQQQYLMQMLKTLKE